MAVGIANQHDELKADGGWLGAGLRMTVRRSPKATGVVCLLRVGATGAPMAATTAALRGNRTFSAASAF
jgi:hypothetical protein